MKNKPFSVAFKHFAFVPGLVGGISNFWPKVYRKVRIACSSLFLFGKAIIRSPRQIGAISPSGFYLAEAMVRNVVAKGGLIVELGAGTGSVTSALLNKGLPPEKIIAIEQSAEMASFLRSRFPGITVIHGDAAKLTQLVPERPIDTIVSSIPLVSMPPADRESIIRQIKQIANGKCFIQFTYFWGGKYLLNAGFKPLNAKLVLMNLPPARVMTFTV